MPYLELNIEPLQQRTNMSCWWTSIQMVLEYYTGRTYSSPAMFSSRFERSWNEVVTAFPAPLAEQRPHIDPATGRYIHSHYEDIAPPYTWYNDGLPNNPAGIEWLCEITGFRGVSSVPAIGSFTIRNVFDMLRQSGPMIFMGNWNGYPHAIVVMGVDDRGTVGSAQGVLYCDPAYGEMRGVSIGEFNNLISGLARLSFGSAYGTLNPIHYPTGNPVPSFAGSLT